tara:strand:- start:5935 stop:7623 length:1689 start_codon:yes stop_codon:yes gene_type:complete
MEKADHGKSPKEAPKHLVLLQLTRAGDLVQTLQAAKEVRLERPNIILTLVARKHYADSLRFLLESTFDHIITIDTPALFTSDLDGAHAKIENLIQTISKTPVSAVVNLSYCKPSRYLTGLIPAKHKLGPWIGSDNQENITDKWSQLLYTTVTQGPLNPFHLVDLFRLILGVKPKALTKQSATPASNTKKNWIVVHPFASADRKKWKLHKWSEILYKLSKDHENCTLFVVGAPNEAKLASDLFAGPLLKTRKNIVNLVGETTLKDVYDRLVSSKLFIGHDSLIGHLASVAKVQTLTLALGSVRPWETTPYGANNVVLSPRTKCFPCFPQDKCSQYICHSDIPYQLVTDFASTMLSGDNIVAQLKKRSNPFLTGSCHMHISTQHSKSLLLDFVEVDEKPGRLSDIMRPFYRMTWALLIGEMEENRTFPTLSRDAHGSLLKIMEGINYLYELSEFGKKYSLAIVEEVAKQSPSLSKIKATSQKIDEIDKLSVLVKGSHPALAPIVDFYGLMRANLPGGNVVEIAQHSFFVYQDTSLACSVLNELIEKTVAEHKITQNRLAPTQSK